MNYRPTTHHVALQVPSIMSSLQQELRVYEAALPALLQTHPGQFVVIRGDALLRFDKTYEAALAWAYDHIGLDRFFVKQIDAEQCVAHLTRDLGPRRQ